MTREAINELKKYTLGRKNTEKVEISVLQIKRVIKALEQEPKTGHWIDETSGYAFNAKCSECGYIVHEQYYTEYKYCPKCGAKME